MTSAIKRRIAREWLIFIVCAVIGLSVIYFAIYFSVQYVGQHFVDVSDAKTKKFLNDQYKALGVIPDGYQTTNSFYHPPQEAPNNVRTREDFDNLLADRQYYDYNWQREEPYYQRKNPREMFGELWPLWERRGNYRYYKLERQSRWIRNLPSVRTAAKRTSSGPPQGLNRPDHSARSICSRAAATPWRAGLCKVRSEYLTISY
jgi:hypothetical protein